MREFTNGFVMFITLPAVAVGFLTQAMIHGFLLGVRAYDEVWKK